jgi:hypothetical protein
MDDILRKIASLLARIDTEISWVKLTRLGTANSVLAERTQVTLVRRGTLASKRSTGHELPVVRVNQRVTDHTRVLQFGQAHRDWRAWVSSNKDRAPISWNCQALKMMMTR